jgi:hypothetical protein
LLPQEIEPRPPSPSLYRLRYPGSETEDYLGKNGMNMLECPYCEVKKIQNVKIFYLTVCAYITAIKTVSMYSVEYVV